jgi:type III pantothenate kinase
MNLVLDIGNTRSKLALFQGDTLVSAGMFDLSEPASVARFLGDRKADHMLISTVKKHLPAFLEDLGKQIPLTAFTADTPVPLKNAYTSANTLGSDRLAGIIGAWKRYPGEAVLLVDSGTCIKYNYLTPQGEYLGGGISPGIDMRFKAMHAYTGRLPELAADYNFDTLIGSNTTESLLSGVMNGVVEEVGGIIKRFETQYPGLKIVLTGGNYHFFEKRLKKPIFAHPNIILEGLNEILEYNVKSCANSTST